MKLFKFFLLAGAISLVTSSVYAQCENEEAVRRTSEKMKAYISTNQQRQSDELDKILASYEAKTDKLGWTKVQKGEFFKQMQENGHYVQLTQKLKQQQLAVTAVQEELSAKDVDGNPRRLCSIAQKYLPIFQKINELNEEIFSYMKKKIAMAK
ncbi:hypothetical protein ACO0LF_27065 [Undibacterium sp. Di27W]|uniref:hypothetical protein n=1 Tax=Undibacterium sp. Di27W TaxID=3413036 RepID=UPI003BF2325C